MKVESALRMAGLPYEVVDCPNPAKAPKGKLPFIEDGAARLADSELILDYLRERHGFDPDRELSGEQRAISRAFQAMLDERLYWVFIQNRWVDPRNWPTCRDAYFSWLPSPVKPLIAEWVRRGIRKEMHGNGLGRHTPEEILAFGIADLRALAAWLGDRPYFHGDEPTRIDAGLIAYLGNLFQAPMPYSPLLDEGRRHPNLEAYWKRGMGAWFPDFPLPDPNRG